MRIAVISSLGPFDRYVIGRILERWPIERIVHTEWERSPHTAGRWCRLRRSPMKTVKDRCRDVFFRWCSERINRQVSQQLFATDQPPSPAVPRTTIASWSINSDETVATLAELQPDLLLVSCAPLLRPEVFRLARLGAVNIHRGIAPKYRGENTVFWPLHFGDLDHCGVTLHWIDEGVDTGPIIARGYPAVSRDETEATLLAKCARLSADLVLELLDAMAEGQLRPGVLLEGAGRNYMRRERTVWAQLRHAWRLFVRRDDEWQRSGSRVEWLEPDDQCSARDALTASASQ